MPLVIHGDNFCLLRLNFTTRVGKHSEDLSMIPQEIDNCESDDH